MLFSSLTFLFFFLPILFIFHLPSSLRWRNFILLLFSIVFYAWGGVSVTAVLLLSVLANHLFAKLLIAGKKKAIYVGVTFNVLLLIFFKYVDFFLENISYLIQCFDSTFEIEPLGVKLPLGISFFTFQGISMLIDINRSKPEKTLKLQDTAMYICFFPQLIAGPILRFNDIIDQIHTRYITKAGIHEGIQRFSIGLFKKVAIANTLGALADSIYKTNLDTLDNSAAWLGIIAYSFQLFFDFSGYSDMAIGLGKLFGFHIPENFNFPYTAKSIQDFWRRWHISLSTWFRDYVYIPLGGNKNGTFKTYRNLILVFFLTGFWHGAAWNFIVWGIFHGVFLLIERSGFGKILAKTPSIFQHVYTLLIVMVGWVFFSQETLNDAWVYLGKMLDFSSEGQLNYLHFLNLENTLFLVLALLFAIPSQLFISYLPKQIQVVLSPLFQLYPAFLFFYCIILLSGSTYNPFIYFRF
jgi:alginate O-acetyltransferase complex protein AlgI